MERLPTESKGGRRGVQKLVHTSAVDVLRFTFYVDERLQRMRPRKRAPTNDPSGERLYTQSRFKRTRVAAAVCSCSIAYTTLRTISTWRDRWKSWRKYFIISLFLSEVLET